MAAESWYDSRAQVTGGRTSGVVECWAPRYWWTYQRRCVNAGLRGSTQERAPPLGNQPENWWAERRSFVSGNPMVFFFNAAGAPEQVSKELYMVSGSLVFSPAWLDFDCAVSEVVTTIALLFFLALSLSSLVAHLIGFLATGFPHSSKVTFRLGPLPLLLRLTVEIDVLFPYFHRRGGRARTVPHRCTVAHIRLSVTLELRTRDQFSFALVAVRD